METVTNLQLRIDDLERTVIELRRIVTQIPLLFASPRVGTDIALYTLGADMGPDGKEMGAGGEDGSGTSVTVTSAEIVERNGRNELQITTSGSFSHNRQTKFEFANAGDAVNGQRKLVPIDDNVWAVAADLPEDYEVPTFGEGEGDATVKRKPSAVQLTPYAVDDSDPPGVIYSTEVKWMLPEAVVESYLPSGSKVVIVGDLFSIKPDRSLVAIMSFACWEPVDPDA